MRQTISRIICLSAVCAGMLNATSIGKNIVQNVTTSATSAVNNKVNSFTNSLGLGNLMGGSGININTNDIFGYSSGNILSGSIGGLQYGCSLDSASFGTGGLGNFSLGSFFKSLDFGFFKCDIGIDLDKATCKNIWYDESKHRLYGAIDGIKGEAKEWGKKGRDWLTDNVLDYNQDKSGIWGYGSKAKQAADSYCQNANDYLWGNGNSGANGGNSSDKSSVSDRRTKNIKASDTNQILFDYVYGNLDQNTVNMLKNDNCFNDNDKIKSIKQEIADAKYNPQSLKDDYKKTVKTVARQCIAEQTNNHTAENVANKAVATMSFTNPTANGSITDGEYSKIKNQSSVIYTTSQAQANKACDSKTTPAEIRACIEAQEADYNSKSRDPSAVESSDGISGQRAKIYKNNQEAFDNYKRAETDLRMVAYPEEYAELESLDGEKDVLLTDEDKSRRLTEINQKNAKKMLNIIKQNTRFSIQEQQMRLGIDSALVASEVFNRQAAVKETNAVVAKSQEAAQQVVNAILGSN